MKIYRKIVKSSGGTVIYLGKAVLNHLAALPGDEITLDFSQEDKVILTKSTLNNDRIQKLLDTRRKS